MAKFRIKTSSLKNSVSALRQYGWRGTQLQVRLTREMQSDGSFQRSVTFERGKRQYHGGKGLIHGAVNMKYRIVGDKPSVTKAINAWQPKSWQGKVIKNHARIANFVVHDITQTAVDTALVSETAALKLGKTGLSTAKRKLQQKYRSEAVDDYHKGTMFIAKGGIDAVKGVRKHFKLKTQYKLEKQKYKLQRDEKKAYRKNSYKPKMKANTADRKHNKAFYKEQKRSFKKADKKSAGYRYRSQVMKYRRRKYRQSKKEIRLERRGLKTDMKYLRKNAFNQWRIKHLSNPGLLILKPARYTGGRLRASAYQKAVNADDSNDFLKAADFAKNHVVDKVVDKVSKDNRLQHREKRRDRLSDREHRADSRLKKREDKLHNKKETYKKNRKKQSIKRHNKKSFSESVRDIFKLVKNVYEKEVKHFFLVILVPILIMLLVLTFILMIFNSVLAGSGFTLGTYAAQDYDLSEAEKYYTKLARDMNEQILKIDSKNWKKALKKLGADTKDMDDKPDNYYWGRSDKLDYDPVYDFDRYKLWSFLCAYYYDFDSKDITYWEYDSDTEELLDEIFKAEYKFEYFYDNKSYWEELDYYNYFGGGKCTDGTYYRCETDAYRGGSGDPYAYKFKPIAYTSELGQFRDGDGYVYLNSNYRVLDPKHKYKVTGYYVFDHRYFASDKKDMPPFYWSDDDGFYFKVGETIHYRSFWGWDDEDAWFMVSPTDTEKWNSDITDACMYGYYEKYTWKTDCRLYYNVKQKKTFDKVIESKLKKMSHGKERLEYYKLLAGQEDGADGLYGNHQTLKNIVSGDTIIDYVDGGRILNGFGWDMQAWNEKHCELSKVHEGIDIKYKSGSKLYAPFDCKIKSVDTKNNIIVLRKDDVLYWYDGTGGTKRDTEITIENAVLKEGLAKGDTIKSGKYFALSTSDKHCEKKDSGLSDSYVHLKVKIDTDGVGWDFIDPLLVLY